MRKNVWLLLTLPFTGFYFKISNNVKGHNVYHNRTKFKRGYKNTILAKSHFSKINIHEKNSKKIWPDYWYEVGLRMILNKVESKKQYPNTYHPPISKGSTWGPPQNKSGAFKMSQQKLRVATICYKILFDLCRLQLTSERFMPMVPKCHINTTLYKHQSGTLATCAELVDVQQSKLAKDFTLKPSQLSIALSIFLFI